MNSRSILTSALTILAFISYLTVKTLNASEKKKLSPYQISTINHSLLDHATLIADFVQISENQKSEGVIYIDRKNKRVAIDYLSGNMRIKVISDKFRQYYFDKDLNQASIIPSGSTASKALLTQNINDGSFVFDSVNENENEISMTGTLKGHREEGLLNIKFLKGKVNEISFINIEDLETRNSVSMYLSNFKINAKIDRSIFQVPISNDVNG